jgi:hypothetical protein
MRDVHDVVCEGVRQLLQHDEVHVQRQVTESSQRLHLQPQQTWSDGDPANIHAAAQRDEVTHFSRLQHGRRMVAGVERRNQLALVGESAEGGDAVDVGGGDLQESSRPAVGAVAKLLQRTSLIRGGGVVDVMLLEHGGALDVRMRHLRQRLVHTSEHDAGDAGQLVQRTAQQFGKRAPPLHLRGVAGADGGVEDEERGVFARAALRGFESVWPATCLMIPKTNGF